jgi:hypothetical protein
LPFPDLDDVVVFFIAGLCLLMFPLLSPISLGGPLELAWTMMLSPPKGEAIASVDSESTGVNLLLEGWVPSMVTAAP